MNTGQMVMLIGREDDMPPIGAVGEVLTPADADGEHDVMFDDHPCPVGPDPSWIVPMHWLLPINDGGLHVHTERAVAL